MLSWLKRFFGWPKPLPPLGFEPEFLESNATFGDAVSVSIEDDDTTPMEFVVRVLVEYFQIEHRTAVEQMLKVHTDGTAQARVMTKPEATRLVQATTDLARSYGYPLKLSIRPLKTGTIGDQQASQI